MSHIHFLITMMHTGATTKKGGFWVAELGILTGLCGVEALWGLGSGGLGV